MAKYRTSSYYITYDHELPSALVLVVCLYIMTCLALENYGGKVFLVLDSVSTTVLTRL